MKFFKDVEKMSSSNGSSGGIGFAGILFCIFLVLKLCGIISWSWWWVTCPLWIGFAIGLGFLAFGAIAILLVGIIGALKK